MTKLKEFLEKEREIEARTSGWERLGFCPYCDMVWMMEWGSVYDNGVAWYGRFCNECNYVSEYHTDIVGGFIDESLERRLREIRGPKALLKELYRGHYGEKYYDRNWINHR